MSRRYVGILSSDEITARLLKILTSLEPLSPMQIENLCRAACGDETEKLSKKKLLNCYFDSVLGFKCSLSTVSEDRSGNKNVPSGYEYDVCFLIQNDNSVVVSQTYQLPAPLSVCNFLEMRSATSRPRTEVKLEETIAIQAAALLNSEDFSVFRTKLVKKALRDVLVSELLESHAQLLHDNGFYVDEIEKYLAEEGK